MKPLLTTIPPVTTWMCPVKTKTIPAMMILEKKMKRTGIIAWEGIRTEVGSRK
jgi:hypothetical protein